jgi:RNA polymerase sigma-70 factor (ECF subfamily)
LDGATAVAGTDAEQLHRLQHGDDDAWAELCALYSPRLYQYLRHNLPTNQDAEDALSETLLAAVRALPNFDGNVTLSAFLYALAYRKVADFWRRQRSAGELHDGIAAPAVQSDQTMFEEALDTLPETARQVLLLRYQVGLSVTEVAEVIERSYKGTESLLSRARAQLKTALDEAGIAYA